MVSSDIAYLGGAKQYQIWAIRLGLEWFLSGLMMNDHSSVAWINKLQVIARYYPTQNQYTFPSQETTLKEKIVKDRL